MAMLNKYGTRWKDKKISLWCGINGKMVVSRNKTNAFFGPLSTSSSYHVANVRYQLHVSPCVCANSNMYTF